MSQPVMASQASASNGFFGTVLSGIGEGIAKTASEVLPVWASKQLNTGSPNTSPNPIGNETIKNLGNIFGINYPAGTAPGSADALPVSSQFLDSTKNYNAPVEELSNSKVLIVGALVIGAIVLFKFI
jgi:hypothetical protein